MQRTECITVRNMDDDLKARARRLDRAIDAAGYLTTVAFADAVGAKQPAVHLHRTGGRTLTMRAAEQYAPRLGVTASWLLYGDAAPGIAAAFPVPAVASRENTPGARIQAVRSITWREGGIEVAAAAIGIKLSELEAVERGEKPMPDDALLRLCAMAGCPVEFIKSGAPEGLRWELSAWLGHVAPHLIPGLSASEEAGQSSAGGSA